MSEHTLTIDGLQIYCRVEGEGPPVVLVHGWPTSSYIWRRLIDTLAASRRVYALDLPGFGRSDKPLDAPYTFTYFGRFIGGIIEAFAIEQTDLIVHDIGGPSGILWAVEHPQRLRKLVIVDAPIYTMKTPLDRLSHVLFHTPGIRSLLVSRWGLKKLFRMNVVDKTVMSDEVLEHYLAPFPETWHRRLLRKTILSPLEQPNELADLAGRMAALQAPVAVIYGEADQLCGAHMKRLGAELPAAHVVALANCGHYIQEDCPDRLAREVVRFLDG